jgi:hypothetical protein
MPRLPTSGSSLMTPCREESELKRVLSELCRGSIFDDAAVHQYYMKLASLIGGWLSERARLETVPVKNALVRKGVVAREEARQILLDAAISRSIEAEALKQEPGASKTTMEINDQSVEILKFIAEHL